MAFAQPDDIRLKDGSPAYHALLSVGGDGIVDKKANQTAQINFANAMEKDRDSVLKLQGATEDEARRVLQEILA